jgi:hypothetical protein
VRRRLVLRGPAHLERVTWWPCRDCDHEADYTGHTMTLAACEAERTEGPGPCPAPEEHHAYRPRQWWRMLVRRALPWEGTW